MRVVDVRLPREYLQILETYGTLSDIANKALEEISKGNLPEIADMPALGYNDSHFAKKLVSVENEDYETLVATYGPHSSRISLRRLFVYLVESEMIQNLGFIPKQATKEYCKTHEYCMRVIKRLYQLAPEKYIAPIAEIIEKLNTLS